MESVSKQYEELISYADLYDNATFEAKKMIVNQLILQGRRLSRVSDQRQLQLQHLAISGRNDRMKKEKHHWETNGVT